MAVSAIECIGLWKIFGEAPARVLADVKELRLSRAEALKRHGCFVAVADVSLSVDEGEIFCVMGLSGSGKSTLARHINRLVEPNAGSVRIFGSDIGQLSPAGLRKFRSEKIGMVFQHVALLPHKTVSENVSFGLEIRGIKKAVRERVAKEKLELVRLEGWGDRFPHELSGGMQQRVGLARAFASDTPILLMDEPFSALDPLIRRELQIEFRRLAKLMNKTVLFITHDIEEAIFLGDRIAIMKDGELRQIASPQEIVLRPADDYVAEFVRHASRLKLLQASMLMEPIPISGRPFDRHFKVRQTDDLELLIGYAIEGNMPMVVLDDVGSPVGMVTQKSLLAALNVDSSSGDNAFFRNGPKECLVGG